MQNEHEGLERKKMIYQWLILMRMDFCWISKAILSTISRVDNEAVREMKPPEAFTLFCSFRPAPPPIHPHNPPIETLLFFLLSIQDRIMWKMNHGAATEITWPPRQNHARQIDIIRQRPWVIFLRKCFKMLPLFLPPSPPPLHSPLHGVHLFFIGCPNKSRNARSIVPGLVRLSRARLGRVRTF